MGFHSNPRRGQRETARDLAEEREEKERAECGATIGPPSALFRRWQFEQTPYGAQLVRDRADKADMQRLDTARNLRVAARLNRFRTPVDNQGGHCLNKPWEVYQTVQKMLGKG